MLRDFLLKLCKAFHHLKGNLVLMKDASLTAMENEGSILYSQGTLSQNKESSLMVKRVIPYCLIFTESIHVLDDGKTHRRHPLCPLRHYSLQTSVSQVSRALYIRPVASTFKRSKATEASGWEIQKGGWTLLSLDIFTISCKCSHWVMKIWDFLGS